MKKPDSIRTLFSFNGLTALSKLHGVFGDRYARVIQLRRRKKQRFALNVDSGVEAVMTRNTSGLATCLWQAGASTWSLIAGALTVRGAIACV